ncbi:MAG: aminotransferase class I/II [Thermoprotei archaeon ex4572_64]|nr:MAG: aminotransferase class I/II [Thermoprotei archaeon ex4572_64]
MMFWQTHGGVDWRESEKFLDFSSNMNPLGPPEELVQLIVEACLRKVYKYYPNPSYEELKSVISDFERVELPEYVYVFNGASEALQTVFTYLKPETTILVKPSYVDYWRLAYTFSKNVIELSLMIESEEFKLPFEKLINIIKSFNKPLVILCNPNNPTGTLIKRETLQEVVMEISRRSGFLIIDESFMNFIEDSQSLIKYITDNLIIIKSYTKFFSIPGLRFGICISTLNLQDHLTPWRVNSIIDYALSKYLRVGNVEEFKFRTINFVKSEVSWMLFEFRKLGLKCFNSYTNFFIVKYFERDLYNELLKRRIKIRDASNIPGLGEGYYRVSIRNHEDNVKLVHTLKDILERLGE